MATQLQLEGLSSFEVRTWPSAAEFGRALESNVRLPGALLQLRFGDQVAGLPVSDLWSACCELLLEAQLVREGRLDHFVLDVEQIFELTYSGDLLFCIFSREHVFAVDRESFAASLEHVVEEVFSATTCPRLMHIAARWGASALRGLPYSYRFSDSVLT
jgi:hypothetical protein